MKSSVCYPKPPHRTYTAIQGLSGNELKALCLRHHIPNTLPKSARVIFLCHALEISTVGINHIPGGLLEWTKQRLSVDELHALKVLTPIQLLRNPGWTKDLKNLPDIDGNVIKNFLLKTNLLDVKLAKRYRLSRAYQLKQFIHSVTVLPHDNSFVSVQARCNPSQSCQAEDVKVLFVVLDAVNGDPCAAFCTCTVGFSQSCGHIGALLFALEEWVSSGLKLTPNQPACTELTCSWINPKGAAVKPKHFADIGDTNQPNKRRRTEEDFGRFLQQSINTLQPPTAEQVATLRAGLLAATTFVPPAVYALDPSRFRKGTTSYPLVTPPTHLADVLDEFHQDLAYAKEVTISTRPLPIADLPHQTFPDATHIDFCTERDRFIKDIHYSNDDRHEIALLTIGQNTNIDWFQQKFGALTSSNFKRISTYMNTRRANPDNLVRDIMGYRISRKSVPVPKVPSLKHGIRYESVARDRYILQLKSKHKNLHVDLTGLRVHPVMPILRASPDGIVRCDCHEDRLLEIKCPYASKDISVRQAIREKKINYLEMSSDFHLSLKEDSAYYDQVQGAMAVTSITTCEFVVYTKKTLEIMTVPFSSCHWNKAVNYLQEFFAVYVVPEILTSRILNMLPVEASDKPHVTTVVTCEICKTFLPEANDIRTDNSNASVGCDCDKCNCSSKNKWFCWPCVGYSDALAEDIWLCRECNDTC